MDQKSLNFYEEVRQKEIIWVTDFVKHQIFLSKQEIKDLNALIQNIQIDTIGDITVYLEKSPNVSKKSFELFYDHVREIEWFDWRPGEKFRHFNGHMYARPNPFALIQEDLLDAYYKEQPPEERTSYEVTKYLNAHPRIAKSISQEKYDELYNKFLKRFTREYNNRQKAKAAAVQEQQDNITDTSDENDDIQLTLFPIEHIDTIIPDPSLPNNESNQENEVKVITSSEIIPVLNFNTQYMNNTKLARILATKQIDIINSDFDLLIKEKTVNLINISADKNISLSSNNITPYDLSVMDAAYTIMCEGYTAITPEGILKVMSGNKDQKITEKKLNEVTKSIEKLQSVRIKIDCTNEYNKFQLEKGKKPVESWTYESYLLPLGKIETLYEANGKSATAYTILEKPALYRYAEMNHQIVAVPAYLLETQDQFSDTDEAVLIKRYVIRRVAQIIKSNGLNSNKLSYLWYDKNEGEERGLFPELGYNPDNTPNWRKKKAKINEIVKGTLQTLLKGQAIINYEEYREDGTNNPASPIIGYKIFYNKSTTVIPT